MSSYAERQMILAVHRKQQEASSRVAGEMDYGQCGPPNWDRAAWEAFKRQFGYYPFGHDGQGGFLTPPSYDEAPSWVFELMGLREPPVRPRRV